MMSAIVDEYFDSDKQNMWVGLTLGLRREWRVETQYFHIFVVHKELVHESGLEKYQKTQRPPMIIPITEEKILQISRYPNVAAASVWFTPLWCVSAFVYWNAFGVQTQYVSLWKRPPVHNARAEFCSAKNRRGDSE